MKSQTGSATIRTFLRGSSSELTLSSNELCWPGLVVERHTASACELPGISLDSAMLMLWQGTRGARGEYMGLRGTFQPYVKRSGMMTLYRPGRVPSVRAFTDSEFLLCSIDQQVLTKVANELGDEHRLGCTTRDGLLGASRPVFSDPVLYQLLLLLQDEAKSGGTSGQLYAEHLSFALIARLATLAANYAQHPPKDDLGRRSVQHVVDRFHATPLAEFTISELAADCGLSYTRFFRAFRQVTGLSPHQYLIRLRLEMAKRLMRNRSASLLDVALESGFDSHAHFTRMFSQCYGVPPSVYRHSL